MTCFETSLLMQATVQFTTNISNQLTTTKLPHYVHVADFLLLKLDNATPLRTAQVNSKPPDNQGVFCFLPQFLPQKPPKSAT